MNIVEYFPGRAIVHPADALGELKARIADLEALAKVEHARLVAMGAGAHEGETFRATVSVADISRTDWKAVAAKLEPSYQLVAAWTTAKPVTTVRVVARNGR